MYWIEIGCDGSYLFEGRKYLLPAEGIVPLDSYESERVGNDRAKITMPFQLSTDHGTFCWNVEIFEYLKLGVASFIGYSITQFPDGVILKDEVTFCLQDGWLNPTESGLDMTPRMTKMRLV